MNLTVSEPMAEFFMEQCAGTYTGHMANIPNNPVLFGIIQAHRAMDKQDFARFLRQVADQLTKEQKF
jgi:hypothetical protein